MFAHVAAPLKVSTTLSLTALRQNGFALEYADEVLHRNRKGRYRSS